jgi:hypothetical protein
MLRGRSCNELHVSYTVHILGAPHHTAILKSVLCAGFDAVMKTGTFGCKPAIGLTFTRRARQIPQPFLDFLCARLAGIPVFVFVKERDSTAGDVKYVIRRKMGTMKTNAAAGRDSPNVPPCDKANRPLSETRQVGHGFHIWRVRKCKPNAYQCFPTYWTI